MGRSTHNKDGARVPKRVYVARTLVTPQPEASTFLDEAARNIVKRIGEKTLVNTIGALHITLLESAGTTPAFRHKRFTPQDVHRFSAELQQYLSDIEGTSDSIVVEIDPSKPLRWFGWSSNQLALNVMPNDRLRQEREHIEAFLRERFGSLPELRTLDEHIVFAAPKAGAVRGEILRNPLGLLPEGIVIPDRLALNGLMVFLNGIGDSATFPVEHE